MPNGSGEAAHAAPTAGSMPAPPINRPGAGLLWRLGRHRLGLTGLTITVLMTLLALAGPSLLPGDPTALDVMRTLSPPSAAHWFGTDDFGRDLLARVVYGMRTSLFVGGAVLAVTVVLGALPGLLAGYFPMADHVIMRVMDALMAFPAILLALAVLTIAGPAALNVVLALGIAYSPRMARLARASAISVRFREYVESARAMGASSMRILTRHVIPNALAALIVQGTFTFAYAILGEAALSFVGLGTPPPAPSLGNILADARPVIREAPWMVLFPSLTLTLTILGLNLFGDGIRDVLDPRMRL